LSFLLGTSFGLILFLLAAGLSLTMGLMRILNLAHGALYMVGAYAGLKIAGYTHNYMIGILAGAVCAGLVGLLMETAFLRRLFKQDENQCLLTLGMVYILTNLVQWICGTYPLSGVVPAIFSGSVAIGTINFPVYRFFLIGFGLLMAFILWLFQEKTKIGATVRAGMDNREVTGALGINLKVIFTGIFTLGALVAGFCGVMGAPLTGVNLGTGMSALLYAMIVVTIGGYGSIQGALLGGIIIGLVNAFGTAYFPQSASYIIYGALILMLLFRPSGLLGRKLYVQTATENLEKTSAPRQKGGVKFALIQRMAGVKPTWQMRLYNLIPYLAMILLLAIVPPFLPTYFQGMVTEILIFALFAVSLDIVMGYAGLISFGHAAFFGVGGYAVGILTVHLNISSFWIVAPLAIVIAALLSTIIMYVSLRVGGVYFMLITMAFGELLAVVATKWGSITGGTSGLNGIHRPDLGIPGFTWTSTSFYYMVLIIFIICFFILYRIANSSFGRSLVGIRENEERMRSLGFNTWLTKYVALILAGTFAGIAGILFAYFYRTMAPSFLATDTSALAMLMVIIGGSGTLFGPCLGAAAVILIKQFTVINIPDRWPLILGTIFVIFVMLIRSGLYPYLNGFWNAVRFQKVKIPNTADSVEN